MPTCGSEVTHAETFWLYLSVLKVIFMFRILIQKLGLSHDVLQIHKSDMFIFTIGTAVMFENKTHTCSPNRITYFH